MEDLSNNQLPGGAEGFEIGEVVFIFANDKLVIAPKTLPSHFTVHLGPSSHIFDIHETRTAADGSKSYSRLFSISHANLSTLLQEIAMPSIKALRGLLRPLRRSWMTRNCVKAFVGLIPMDSDLLAVTEVRHKKLVFDLDKIASHIQTLKFPEDFYNLRDRQIFTLFQYKNTRKPRRIGFGFKLTDPAGRPLLVRFPERQALEVFERIGKLFEATAYKYGTFYKALPW